METGPGDLLELQGGSCNATYVKVVGAAENTLVERLDDRRGLQFARYFCILIPLAHRRKNTMNRVRPGRKCKPRRIKIQAFIIEDGKQRHFFSVVSTASATKVMKAMQQLRDNEEP